MSVADVFPLPKYAAEQREGARRALDSIRLEDGMSQREAEIIAVVYFFNSVSGCGGPYDPRKSGDRWVFKLLVGAAGAYSGDMVIEASTGRIIDNGDVVFSSLADLRRDAVDHYGRRYWYAWFRHLF